MIFNRLKACLEQYRRAERGVVAIIFALSVLPIMGLVGAGVDYGASIAAKSEIDAIADSAALLGAGKANLTASTATAKTRATDAFNAQLSSIQNGVTVSGVTVTVTDSANVRTVVVSYTASRPTKFVGILGVSNVSFSGSATSQIQLASYIDFHLLLDNTPSMGVGATTSDISKLETKYSCAFACHIEGSTTDAYVWAKNNNVTLRIDVLRSATKSLMDTAASTQTTAGQFRMGIHTFGSSCTSLGMTTITPLTSNLTAAKTAANAIDLMTIPYQGYNDDQCTDFVTTMTSMNSAIDNPGSGASGSPQKILFFVADGVNDSVKSSYGCSRPLSGSTRCQEPINTTQCAAIKARGIRIAVLYTTYLPIPSNSWYNSWIAPFQNQIPTKMQECASPGLYFEVSPSQGITEAMTALFQKAVAEARLTR